MKRIGIIGGSGLYDIEGMEIIESVPMETPFGAPSDAYTVGRLAGREVVFLPRHGKGHRFLPSEVNYRANVWGMKKLGVEWLISVSAVGSLKKEIRPLDIVLADQFVDRTRNREHTFFGDGIVAHIAFAHPTCSGLRAVLVEAAEAAGFSAGLHNGGTYLNMEGPAFSTRAESSLFRSWGMDVIGMTTMTEARLAREAELCFATMALVTDYDCWFEDDPEASVSVEMVVQNVARNVEHAKAILREAVSRLGAERECDCGSALANAVMTDPGSIPKAAWKKHELLLSKYNLKQEKQKELD
ncbi:S-methyl-5'-thioadenosine phosphorylase [bacterium]|nr:S-methyl-5'-thioadenosine phosphorylase [bacterium]